jgi:hypothetical protein
MNAMWNRPAAEALGLRFDRPAGRVAAGLALAALWLLGRRYGGITHDATLYLAQALHRLDPEAFSRDLFFAHGSQDAYSIFSLIYAPLVSSFGPGRAAMALTILGQLAFFAAAWSLARRIAPAPARWWSLALLALVSGYYGGGGVFRFAEPFATARTLAEPLVLAALAFTLASRPRPAAASLFFAALLHPLVAAAGIAVVLAWHAVERKAVLRFAIAGCAAAGCAAFVWPGIGPRLDAAWTQALVERSPHLFALRWPLPDWARIVWSFCLAALAWRFSALPVRRLIAGAAIVAAAGIGASVLAVDLARSGIAAGLQMWRAHWVLQVIALLVAPATALALWQQGRAGRLAAACVMASCCFGRAELPASAALALLALALDVCERRSPGWLSERLFRLALLAVVAAASCGLLFDVQARLPLEYLRGAALGWKDYIPAVATAGSLLPLAALWWLLVHSRLAAAASFASLLAFAAALFVWDGRGSWSRLVEQQPAPVAAFRQALPHGAQVFWPAPSSPAWLVLRTPNWFSIDQGAGIVFNRATAIEYAARGRASLDLRTASTDCVMASGRCSIAPRRARAVCGRADAPDYLVLDGAIRGVPAVEDFLPIERPHAVYLYACRDIPASAADRR